MTTMTDTGNYVEDAEKVMEKLKDVITTSQIRNLLAMTAEIYNDVRLLRDENLDAPTLERVAYLRMRCVYEAWRKESVKSFIKESGILDELKEIKTKKEFVAFAHYMEALVAWHRYKGGKD